ncbi:MAG: hypothetical protein DHS80DRAFT_30978, partial [Piptocephalis tieghemiana]
MRPSILALITLAVSVGSLIPSTDAAPMPAPWFTLASSYWRDYQAYSPFFSGSQNAIISDKGNPNSEEAKAIRDVAQKQAKAAEEAKKEQSKEGKHYSQLSVVLGISTSLLLFSPAQSVPVPWFNPNYFAVRWTAAPLWAGTSAGALVSNNDPKAQQMLLKEQETAKANVIGSPNLHDESPANAKNPKANV